MPNPPTDNPLADQEIPEVENKISESPAEMTKSPIPAWHFFYFSKFKTLLFLKKSNFKKILNFKMIYSRMDNNFELVPLETKGATGWIYLYLRSFVGWILSFFDIYEIKEWFSHGFRAKSSWELHTTDSRQTKPGSVLNTRISAFWSTFECKRDFSRDGVV